MPNQLRIIVEVDEAQLWGEECPRAQGFDPYLSGRKFCDLLRQRIKAYYPNSDLRVEYTDHGDVRPHVTSWTHGASECQMAELVIDDMTDLIYDAHEWEVAPTKRRGVLSPWV